MADPQIPRGSGGSPAPFTVEVSPEPTGPFDPPDVRLGRIDTLVAACGGEDPEWVAFAERMRFRIGATEQARRVPFAIGTEFALAMSRALDELVALIGARLEGPLSESTARFRFGGLRDRHWGLRIFRDGSPEHAVAWTLLAADVLLDAGILETWLLRGGAGGRLLMTLRKVYLASLEEEVRHGEPTAWAAHLALQSHAAVHKEGLKALKIQRIGYEALERVVGEAISAVQQTAAADAAMEIRGRGIPREAPSLEWLPAASSPLSLVGIRQSILRQTPNPYGITRELGEGLDAFLPDPLSPALGATWAEKVPRIVSALQGNRPLRALALDVAAVQELRGAIVSYLRDFDVGGEPRNEALLAAVLDAPTLTAALRSSKAFGAGLAAARDLAASAEGIRGKRLDGLIERFERAGRRASGSDEERWLRDTAKAWLLVRGQQWVESKVDRARDHLFDRAKEFEIAELKQQYEAGKVYRFAPDDQPVLMVRMEREDAHLFLDLKGFTRMLATNKESTTAEFLKHEFYQPIIERALGYRQAGRRLELNNLLGDAVSFSGDVVAMIYLAEEIRSLFAEHEARLKARGVATGRIEAGLFIAFGAPAETITIDSAGWGDAGVTEFLQGGGGNARAQRIKVAISEKINESARGTARNGAVWSRIQGVLETRRAESAAAGDLELPWSVYVDSMLQLSLPQHLMSACERALESGDAAAASNAAERLAEAVRSELQAGSDARAGGLFSRMGDIYNIGRAISKEAVDAFVRETSAMCVHVERELEVASLPGEFSRFVFVEPAIRLTVSYDTGKARRPPMVFRYAGELSFRGFEGLRVTAIYELLDPDSPFYKRLDSHYLKSWRP